MDISLRSEGPWVAEDRSWLGSRHGTEATRTITLDTSAFTANTHYPNGYVPSGLLVSRLASGLYGPYAGVAAEVQTVTITGTPTGGTFTLTFDGQTTAAIAYNAAASAVQTALEALSSVAPGDVVVGGGPGPGTPYTVTFGGTKSGDQPVMTASGASLTGGSSPAVAVTTTTPGGSTGTTEVAAGHLFSSIRMTSGGADVGAALLTQGVVVVAKLPANSGLDAAARNALSRIEYR
jgi:hypothetical protein